MELRKTISPIDYSSIADDISNLAECLRMQYKYVESELLYRECLAIQNRIRTYPHPTIADSMLMLAHTLYSQNRLEEAEELLIECH